MKNTDYIKAIDKFIEDHREDFLKDLAELIHIDSSCSKSQPGMPFGKGPAEALDKAAEIGKRLGFYVRNFDNHVITLDLKPGAKPKLGILAHLDVVPEGEGWTVPAFDITERDGKIYGRGTTDDKGPAMAAIYAAVAVREIVPELSENCRIILGSAEETGSEDLAYYSRIEKYPPMVFTPDANFPIINFEKGRFAPLFGADWKKDTADRRIISVKGGVTPNVVPHKAHAEIIGFSLEDTERFCDEYSEITGVKLSAQALSESIMITAEGVASHAAHPEEGKNAQTAIISMLANMPFEDGGAFRAVKVLNRLFPHGDIYGEAVGIKMCGEVAGNLTLNFGVLDLDESGFKANFDSRIPDGGNEQNVGDVVEAKFKDNEIRFIHRSPMTQIHHTPEDSELVRTLLDVYERYTGEKGECLAIGGGTYVHDIDGGVAFGCEMPGCDYRIHGADEFAIVDELILSAKMFAAAILDICG